MEDGLNVQETNKRQAECQDRRAMLVYAVGWRDGITLKRWSRGRMICLHGQLGRKDGGGGFKLTFRFLYWSLINQERKYTRRNNLGGNDDLLSYGHVPGSTKSCGPFVFGYPL